MLRLAKHFVVIVAFILLASCTGGGCSGCACAGVNPLPTGFEPERRIENAAALRLTDSGIGFLEQNLGTLAGTLMGGGADGGQITFPVGTQDGSFAVLGFDLVAYELCPGGPDDTADPPKCIAEIDLAGAQLQMDPEAPHNLHVHGPLPLRIQNLPIHLTWLIFFGSDTAMVLNDSGACPGEPQDYANIDLNVDLSIEIDTDPTHVRQGYSRLNILDISLSDTDQISDALQFCGGGLDTAILNGLKGVLVPILVDALIGQLTGPLQEQLCQPANPDLTPDCPEGTENVDGICRYGSSSGDPCASILLGLDGNVDLGDLLSSFSPGTHGAFDFLVAGGGHSVRDDGTGYHFGDLDPIGAGVTLGMYGGTEARPFSPCVPPADVPLPIDVPIPDELHQNTLPDWPADLDGPHFGFALSERFFNYALAQMYNSGALCLGVSGAGIPELSSNLLGLGLGAASMTELGRMKGAQEVAIVVRPQAPPQVEIGNGSDIETDPLLLLTLDDLALDFYIWSLDRFVRAMTVTVDVAVPANLMVGPDGLQPVIENIGLANAVVTNNGLIREEPTVIAGAIEDLVGSLVGGLLGDALPSFNLNEQLTSLGLQLDIPPTTEGQGSPGLRKLTKGSDDYLGLFGTLSLAATSNLISADTHATLDGIELGAAGPTKEALRAGAWSDADLPTATLRLGSSLDDGTRTVEWQYRIDNRPWHPFSTDRFLSLRGHWLLRQGRHVVEVRSRVVGEPLSLDPDPAVVVLTVDDEPPVVRLRRLSDGQLLLRVGDRVSDHDTLAVRVRFGVRDGDDIGWDEWSDWTPAEELEHLDVEDTEDADLVEVEARDEEGNVGTVQHALIRGRVPSEGGSCQCTVPASSGGGAAGAWLLSLLAGTLVWARRRRRRDERSRRGHRLRPAGALVALAVVVGAGSFVGCSCSDDGDDTPLPGCRGRGDCLVLEPGLIGAYSSGAVAPDGTLWVAGYVEANWEDDFPFGDLVVGRYDGSRVLWKAVDGVPDEPEVDIESYDPKGFRGGQTEPGLDVGLWSSLAIDADGNPAVAYYDATNRALRYAHLQGDAWSVSVVEQGDYADLGRYAKLLFIQGRPTISYLFIESGDGGALQSGVRVATGSTANAADVSWSFEAVASDDATPCRAAYCRPGTRCVADSGLCADTADGCSDCGSGSECVDVGGQPVCEQIVAASAPETYPEALGLYVSAAPHPSGGVALAFYDRIHGNVMVARPGGGGWTTVIADGEAGGVDTGDMGIGTSLAVDAAGNYHVAYVDGVDEALNYVLVTDGATPGTPEVVDDGYGAAGQSFADGKHLVGDDSNILVTQGGDVRITYQDASAGTLRLAVGTTSGSDHAWATSVIAQEGFAGAFSRQVEYAGALRVMSWWREASPFSVGDVRVMPAP